MSKSNPNKKTKVGNRKAGSRKGGELSNTHPPMMSLYQMTWDKVLRFLTTQNVINVTISYADLLNTILFASTATAPYCVFDYVKIKRVSIWSGSSSSNFPTTVSVQFSGGSITGNAGLFSDTSVSIYPACVHAKPSKAIAQFFQTSSASAAFTINCPAGSVIDVQLSMRDIQTLATAAQNASVGATVGGIFYRGLDGEAAASTVMPPVGGVPTF
jgi:hypothetical protein